MLKNWRQLWGPASNDRLCCPILEGLVALKSIPGICWSRPDPGPLSSGLICWLNYRHGARSQRVLEAYRADNHQIIEVFFARSMKNA